MMEIEDGKESLELIIREMKQFNDPVGHNHLVFNAVQRITNALGMEGYNWSYIEDLIKSANPEINDDPRTKHPLYIPDTSIFKWTCKNFFSNKHGGVVRCQIGPSHHQLETPGWMVTSYFTGGRAPKNKTRQESFDVCLAWCISEYGPEVPR